MSVSAERLDAPLDGKQRHVDVKVEVAGSAMTDIPSSAPIEDEQTFQYSDSRKLGVTGSGSVFLILNKTIGTGSECFHSILKNLALTNSSILNTFWYFRGNRIRWRQSVPLDHWQDILLARQKQRPTKRTVGILTACGLNVFPEFELASPKSGGERTR